MQIHFPHSFRAKARFLKSITLAAMAFCCAHSPLAAEPVPAADANFRSMKYGFFVHYVWGGEAYSVTVNKDGSKPAGIDDLADRFDAEGFARDLQTMGVEYVLFTAWHANMNPLYPSKVMDKWLPGHSSKRDVIGDMIKACKAKGVQVLLYTHPRDGHDLSDADMAKTGWHRGQGSNPDFDKWDKAKWNDFINEAYGELVERYGNDILGLYLDEGSGSADSYRVVDYPRLRKTITGKHPHLLMMHNDYGNIYTADIGNKEIFYHNGFDTPDGDQWPSYKIPISVVVGSIFWAAFPEGKTEPAQKSDKVGFNKWIPYTPESMFRYTVLQAGSNTDGGGTLWAAGPYPGGGWESGVLDRMKKTGALIKPVERSIKNTLPSTSYRTAPGTKIADLTWGVATRAIDDRIEYLHILKPPANGSTTLNLPAPADGKKFSKAILLDNGKTVSLKQEPQGLTLSLPPGTSWNRLNTVIALQVAADSPTQNVATWKGCRASSHMDVATHPAMASDDKLDTTWSSDPQDASPWLAIDLGKSLSIGQMELHGKLLPGDRIVGSNAIDFSQAVTLATSEGMEMPKLEILTASYGAGGNRSDLTEKLRQMASGGSLRITADNQLAGGDPAPDQPKELIVQFKIGDEPSTRSVKEGESLSIGNILPWTIRMDGKQAFRHLRVERSKANEPMQVSEWRVFASF